MSIAKSFYEKNTLLAAEIADKVEIISSTDEQPSFIHQAEVNGRTLAFLGKTALRKGDLQNKYIRTTKMVIPAGARMVNPDALRSKLQASTIEEKDFLGEALEETIMVEVCYNMATTRFDNLHFHICNNYQDEIEIKAPLTDEDGHEISGDKTHNPPHKGGTCQGGIYTTYVKNGVLKRDLVIFYISKAAINQSNEQIIEHYQKNHPGYQHEADKPPIQSMLNHYFNHIYLEDDFNVMFELEQLEGIFLIPTLFSDQRVVYHCIPDASLSSINPPKETKDYQNGLLQWLTAMSGPIAEDQEVAIGGDDQSFIYIEGWSIFICKNSFLKIFPKTELYHEGVLSNASARIASGLKGKEK